MAIATPTASITVPRRYALNLLVHRDPLRFFQGMSQRYGDRARLVVRGRSILLLSHPDDIREVLVAHPQAFSKTRVRGVNQLSRLLGNGLLTSEGIYHHHQRVLLQPAFHRQHLETYAASMVQAASDEGETWQAGMTLDMAAQMKQVTLRIVGETLFGMRVDSTAATVHTALTTAMGTMRRLGGPLLVPFTSQLPLPANREFQGARQQLDAIIAAIIAERRQSGQDTGDMLSLLLFSEDGDGHRLTDEQIRDEALTLFLAGHETTANALSWAWYLLSQHPEVMARLHAELTTVLNGRPPTLADLPQLNYTHRVITEAMRLYPPAWIITRQATQDVTINDLTLHAGEIVLMSQYVVHHDARWYAEPGAFAPERWAAMPEDSPRFAYFPFGGGPRLCIGERFAWMEAELVLATLAQQWYPHLVPGHPVVPQPLVTLRPRYGLQMSLTRQPG